MRITQNTLFNGLRHHLMHNGNDLLRAQEVVATQKNINRLSDDAVASGRILNLNTSIARSRQFISNIERVTSLAEIQDSTLGQAADLVARAKELLLAESNEVTSTTQTREAARIEIAQLTMQMLHVANTSYDGQYIFSGFATQTRAFAEGAVNAVPVAPPAPGATLSDQGVLDFTQVTFHDYEIRFDGSGLFDVVDTTSGATILAGQGYTSGEPITFDGITVTLTGAPVAGETWSISTAAPGVYQGDGNAQQVEIQPGTFIQQNIAGDRLFQGVGLPGGVDIFDTLNQINLALRDNDRTTMDGMLAQLDTAREQIVNERSSVGSRINLLEHVGNQQADIQTNLEILRSDLEDADIAEAMINLNRRQDIYEATLSASARIVQPSLLDFLR